MVRVLVLGRDRGMEARAQMRVADIVRKRMRKRITRSGRS